MILFVFYTFGAEPMILFYNVMIFCALMLEITL